MRRNLAANAASEKLGSLEEFADWWLARRPIVPDDSVVKAGGNTGQTLYRSGEYQVQLFLCDPNSEIVDHRHPNVDSFEVYVSGDFFFRHSGREIFSRERVSDPSRAPVGRMVRVLPGDWHGATIGPRGGAFFSIQRWEGMAPSSVHLDWEGAPLDRDHAEMLACSGS